MAFPYVSLRWLGPWRPLLWLLVAGLTLLSLSRLGLVLWQAERVAATGEFTTVLLQGVRVDSIQLGMLLLPLALLAPLFAHHRGWRVWRGMVLIWGALTLTLLVFMEASTPAFVQQYDLRPNRLFVEYLKYPREVFATLWEGFRLPLLLGSVLTLLTAWASARLLQRRLRDYHPEWPLWKLWLTFPLVLLLLLGMVRSTTGHRPANPAMFALTADALVNSLVINSTWSVAFALYNLRHEDRSSEIYGTLSSAEMLQVIDQSNPWLHIEPANALPTLHRQTATRQRNRPLNLVIVLEESLGATFVESLGGLPVTPELERLKSQGWWFEQLYATGTRSVRGIEAVVSGFMPTPARSVVKLSLSQEHFFTLADLLGREGYFTEFIYGGEAHFDNMRSFFTGNGFKSVIDQHDYAAPTFVGSWGVSDEDLFARVHERASLLHEQGQPFFTLVFSSSNHSPFEFPDGRIALHDADRQTVNNAVKYADYALGRFFDQAQASAYWQDTLFLVVADHDVRVFGDTLVPVERFHIPGLILGADLEPKRIVSVSSQIDLAPTLLSLMGLSASHPMTGRDMTLPEQQESPGRAFMQFAENFAYMQGQDVTILRPGQPAAAGVYEPEKHRLQLNGQASPDAVRIALAHALLPAWLYREQRYRLPDTTLASR